MSTLHNLARTARLYMAAAGIVYGACAPITEQSASPQPVPESMSYSQLEKKAMGILGINNKAFLKSTVVDQKPYFFRESGIDLMMSYCEGTAKFSLTIRADGGGMIYIEKQGDNLNQPLKEAIIVAVDQQGTIDQILEPGEKADYLKALLLQRVSCPE